MTEVPEHLLARSRARRAGLSGGGDEAAATPATTSETAPAETAAAAPAVAAAPAAPAKVEPKLPWVEAGESRRRIPAWAMTALLLLPIWALVNAFTNDPPSPKTAGPLTKGATVYTTCSSCHGGQGQGGVGPQLNQGSVVKYFPKPVDQVKWVMLGTAGFRKDNIATYGADKKAVGSVGNMPAQIGLPSADLLGVIRHERETIGGEKFDAKAWDEVATTLVNDKDPDVAAKAKEFKAIIDSWKTLPPGA